MLRNFFKLTIRNLWRNPAFSLINILGLSIGMTAALLIGLWIHNELSVDRSFTHNDRIYTMYSREKNNGVLGAWDRTASPLAAELKAKYPEVEDASRFRTVYFLMTKEDKHLNVQGAFADSGFLSILDFPLLQGHAATTLNKPHTIVLTEHLARNLFGDADPMGKTVRIDSADQFVVTGVMKDLPPNTEFTFEYLLPWSYVDQLGWDVVGGTWQFTNLTTYMKLRPDASPAAFSDKIRYMVRSHVPQGPGMDRETFLQPIGRRHLYSRVDNGELVGGRIGTVRLFIVIAVFILLIACINFMNLSTARSERRAREVGIRKVVGALRVSLITQFIGETVLLAGLAFVVALAIVHFSLPAFDQVIGVQLTLDLYAPVFWLFAAGFVFFTGILAGSYPAFFLSSARPVKVLKGAMQKANALITPRKALVVLQFTFAIALITSTLIVEDQLRYARNRDNGYDMNRLAFTFAQGDVLPHYDAIRSELLRSGDVVGVTRTFSPLTRVWGQVTGYSWPKSTDEDKKRFFLEYQADADFVRTTGARLLEGRDLDIRQYPTDSFGMMLNETAVRTMQLEHPLGAVITGPQGGHFHVVGVIKDFIIESPYDPVQPMVIAGLSTSYPVIHFRLNPDRPLAAEMAKVEQIFKRYNPQYPFEWNWVDEAYNNKFRMEAQEGTLGSLFAILTIFISCLGLFGLAAYMAENRRREIGIRKVLGASVSGIAIMISGEFIKLVLIALVIATPISWLGMNNWLDGFNYRTHITATVFMVAGLLAVAIALLTVGYQSIRAALSNPVRSLRSE